MPGCLWAGCIKLMLTDLSAGEVGSDHKQSLGQGPDPSLALGCSCRSSVIEFWLDSKTPLEQPGRQFPASSWLQYCRMRQHMKGPALVYARLSVGRVHQAHADRPLCR